MNEEAINATWALHKTKVTAHEKFFLVICALIADVNGICSPTIKVLEKHSGMDRKTIIELRKNLIRKGLVELIGELNQVPILKLSYVKQSVNKEF